MRRLLPITLLALGACNGWTHEPVGVVSGQASVRFHFVDVKGFAIDGVIGHIGGVDFTSDGNGDAEAVVPAGVHLATIDASSSRRGDWRAISVPAEEASQVEWTLLGAESSDVSLLFVGDVSFEGGIADPNRDGITVDSLVPEGAAAADGAKTLLAQVSPVFSQHDLVTGVLSTTLGDGKTPHPLKSDRAVAPIGVASALAASGIDALNLANDHAWDFLAEGLASTLQALDDTGLGRFGAGRDLSEAIRTRLDSRNSLRVAQVGATSRLGHGETPRQDTPPYYDATESRGGASPATFVNIRSMVNQAALSSDFVVAHVNTAGEWELPGEDFTALTSAAIEEGARLAIGHGPRTLQGLSHWGDGWIASGIGSLVYGSNRPEARYGVMLEAVVRHRQIELLRAHPVALVGYAAAPATGVMADRITRWFGEHSPGATVGLVDGRGVTGSTIRDEDRHDLTVPTETTIELLEGKEGASLSMIQLLEAPDDSSLELGRELIWEGSFEDVTASGTGSGQGAGWTFNDPTDTGVTDRAALHGRLSLGLVRKASNSTTVGVRAQGLRALRAGKRHTFRGCWRLDGEAPARASLRIYPSRDPTAAPSGELALVESEPGRGAFRCFSQTFTPAVETLVAPAFELSRPELDSAALYVDDVSIVEWTPADATSLYFSDLTGIEYARVRSPAAGNARLAWLTRTWRFAD